MNLLKIAACTLSIVGTVAATNAHASVVVTISQSGSDVTTTTLGTIDKSVLDYNGYNNGADASIQGSAGFFVTGNNGGMGYVGFNGPTSFGSGGYMIADTSSGDYFGFLTNRQTLLLSYSYVSGFALYGTSTFRNQTLASLGLDVGSYVFTSRADSITINVVAPNVSPPAVPEPATWAMMIVGFGSVGFAMRRRQQVKVSYAA